jgi:hypothetical protein
MLNHHGRGLDHWLRELVSADPRRRQQAAEAIQAIRFQPVAPGGDVHAHLEAFDAAVREALHAPGIDPSELLPALIGLLREPERAPGGGDQQQAFQQSLAASFAFQALGEEILLMPNEIRAMLRDPRQRWNSLQVIQRLGPKAAIFADDLMAQLDAALPRRMFDAPDALAAVIRDDASRVRRIVDRLDHASPAIAEGAADTLYSLGTRAAQLVPATVETLLAIANRGDSPVRAPAVTALGQVTRGTDVAVDALLAFSRSSDNRIRGVAITALGDVGRQPEKVVPRLIEALDDYEETDPDWKYYSAHERVVRALQAFGEAAAPAVPALSARVRRKEDELDRGVIVTLGKLGPAAREALPLLERLAEEEGYGEEDFRLPDELLEDEDFLPLAILRIRGR